jgi:hypothetical protein
LFLVLRGTPAAIDEELDLVVRGISCGPAQGTKQIGVEVGHGRNFVIEDRHAVRDDAICLAKWYCRIPPVTSIVIVVLAAILRGWLVGIDAEDGEPGVAVKHVDV